MPQLGRRTALTLLGSILLLVVALPALVNLAVSWLWFREIGFETVLTSEIVTRAALMLLAGVTAFAALFINARIAARRAQPLPVVLGDMISIDAGVPRGAVAGLATAASIFLAVLIALVASSGWMTVLEFLNGVPFGRPDPLFGRDVGFFVYTLPVLAGGLSLFVSLTFLSAVLSAGVYLLHGAIALVPPRLQATRAASVHLAVLLALFFVLTALQIWLVGIPSLVYSTTGPFVGASFADANALRPGLHVSAVAALAAAGLVIVGLVRRQGVGYAAAAIAVFAGVSFLSRVAVPAAVQRLVVAPTELTREREFLGKYIEATRHAWGLQDVEVRDIRGEAALTLASVQENRSTVENVRLWDREPLRQTFAQIQEIRTYYDFVSVDDDRYWIDGRYRQVHLSPRELNTASLPTRSFINEHLTFTHGMGVTLAPVNQVTVEGLPVLFIKDLPPVSSVSIRTTRPQIYYGELTNSFAVTNTRQREFDYPSGDANIFTAYEGAGGIPIGSFWRRSLLAWHFRSLKLLLSGDITSESRILFRRNIRQRTQMALPFLRFDSDPYMVIDEAGALHWILDAYTATTRYPYSQPADAQGNTYMRNSVKVVVDAYHGTVRPYIADPSDPLVRTWDKAFAGIMLPLDSMPASLRSHLRYPEDLFRAQAALYTSFHMTEPESFYHREDQWQLPMLRSGESETAFMRRIVMRLPDEDSAEFIFMSPFTPRQKDNLAAWMVARNDGEHYGKLAVYRFPKQSLVFGPQQIVNRMNQDPEIAREVSLWDQRGSEVIRGALMVIPIEESLIYVQPLYLRAEGGRIPELKRVIVAHQNRVVMEETLEEGLARLFGGSMGEASAPRIASAEPSAEAPPAASGVSADLLRQARQHYDRAIEAQRAGDWATYGTEIERLGAILRRMGGGSGLEP